METCAQRSVRHCLDIMVSIYQGMYQEPEKCLVFPQPYEEYTTKLRQKGLENKREKEHANDSRESTLRNTYNKRRICRCDRPIESYA